MAAVSVFVGLLLLMLLFVNERTMGPAPEPKWTLPRSQFNAAMLAALRRAAPAAWVKPMLAVAKLETGDGTGEIFRNSLNAFSIKSAGWSGAAYKGHRVYGTLDDAIRDVVRLWRAHSRYAPVVRALEAGHVVEAFRALESSGYAGDLSDPKQGKDYALKLTQRYSEVV